MNLEKYSFVLAGQLRQDILKQLNTPKSPTQLVKELKKQDSAIARTLRELREQGIIELLTPKNRIKGKVYGLTKEGKSILEKLV